jgi:hypothetical protein
MLTCDIFVYCNLLGSSFCIGPLNIILVLLIECLVGIFTFHSMRYVMSTERNQRNLFLVIIFAWSTNKKRTINFFSVSLCHFSLNCFLTHKCQKGITKSNPKREIYTLLTNPPPPPEKRTSQPGPCNGFTAQFVTVSLTSSLTFLFGKWYHAIRSIIL